MFLFSSFNFVHLSFSIPWKQNCLRLNVPDAAVIVIIFYYFCNKKKLNYGKFIWSMDNIPQFNCFFTTEMWEGGDNGIKLGMAIRRIFESDSCKNPFKKPRIFHELRILGILADCRLRIRIAEFSNISKDLFINKNYVLDLT